MASPGAVRIDKWLWAARFFKTRSAAQQAIDGGKVRLNGECTKRAKDLKPGDRLAIKIEAYEWAITVLRLSVQRGPATLARELYEESEESRLRRGQEVAKRRFQPAVARKGRPTKRDRRELERWRDAD